MVNRRRVFLNTDPCGGESPYLTRYTLWETRLGAVYFDVYRRSGPDGMGADPRPAVSVALGNGYEERAAQVVRRVVPGRVRFVKGGHQAHVVLGTRLCPDCHGLDDYLPTSPPCPNCGGMGEVISPAKVLVVTGPRVGRE